MTPLERALLALSRKSKYKHLGGIKEVLMGIRIQEQESI